jgi:hypothetical protein
MHADTKVEEEIAEAKNNTHVICWKCKDKIYKRYIPQQKDTDLRLSKTNWNQTFKNKEQPSELFISVNPKRDISNIWE